MDTSRNSQTINAKTALKAIIAAADKAEEIGVRINICIVDTGGNNIAFLRCDGAFLASGAIAHNKAYTAVSFGMSTAEFYAEISADPAVLSGMNAQAHIAAFPGGLPIYSNNALIGGIGVSGASAQQDELCAKAALAAIGMTYHPITE